MVNSVGMRPGIVIFRKHWKEPAPSTLAASYRLTGMERIQTADGIITEGAAYLPELMKQSGVDCRHYLCMTPTRDFQVLHYRERDWIPYILEGCSDREKAFQNWMERDALFAEDVKRSAGELGYRTLLIDGSAGEDDIFREVCRIFGL